MASQVASAVTPDVDFAEHLSTYRLFVSGVKYGTISVVAVLIILAFVTL